MTKKHFIALADAMRDVLTGPQVTTEKEVVIRALCAFMRGQNGAFNEHRWRGYLTGECGPSGGNARRVDGGERPWGV